MTFFIIISPLYWANIFNESLSSIYDEEDTVDTYAV